MTNSINLITSLSPNLHIAESGIDIGNLDKKYSSEEELKINRRRFFAGINFAEKNVIYMDAKGGSTFVDLDRESPTLNIFSADAFITTRKNTGLALFPADCVPLVLYDPSSGVLALVHLGWKGCISHLHRTVIEYMQKHHNVEPKNLVCYLGPSIKAEHYVMPDTHPEQKTKEWANHITPTAEGNFMIDLPGYVVDELVRCGVNPRNITVSPEDTASSNQKFFSNYQYNHAETKRPKGRNGFLVWINDAE